MKIDLGFRGVIKYLYSASRLYAGMPLSEAFVDMTLKGDVRRVLVVTGFKVLPRIIQETDGPPGVSVLAKVLIDLGLDVAFAIEEDSVEILKACLEVLGIKGKVYAMPIGVELDHLAKEVLNEFRADLLIFVEKAGCNERGVYHNMLGIDISRYHAKAEALLSEAKRRGIKVLSIGDGGNEVGFGLIKNAVELYVPRGRDCGCPCRGGIAASSKADLVIPAFTSNAGCYALSCALSIAGGVKWPHNEEIEMKMLKAAVDAGAFDGMTGEVSMKVDGIPVEVMCSIVKILQHIVESSRGKLKF